MDSLKELLRRDARFAPVARDPRFQAVLDSMAARSARQRARVEAEEAAEAGAAR